MTKSANHAKIPSLDSRKVKKEAGWREDLEATRDVQGREKSYFSFAISWFEQWRIGRRLEPGVDSARAWWKKAVLSKARNQWQLDQWAEAIRWYLGWLEEATKEGRSPVTVPERVRNAVERTGCRRGLALSTRQTYSGWVARYGEFAGTARACLDPAVAREWLSDLVERTQISFSTQKQALNALVFFFKDVCGFEEVDLGVKLRKTSQRIPVVLSEPEVGAVLEKLEPKYRGLAEMQYGAGLRLSELVNLRVKDIDLDRKTVTVRGGKGDRVKGSAPRDERRTVTVLPESLCEALKEQVERTREIWRKDRDKGRPGVFIPGALGRKFSKAGETFEWFFSGMRILQRPKSIFMCRWERMGWEW